MEAESSRGGPVANSEQNVECPSQVSWNLQAGRAFLLQAGEIGQQIRGEGG